MFTTWQALLSSLHDRPCYVHRAGLVISTCTCRKELFVQFVCRTEIPQLSFAWKYDMRLSTPTRLWCSEFLPVSCSGSVKVLSRRITKWAQSGVESYHILSLLVIFRKKALKLVNFLRNAICNLRHPMHLRHSASHSKGAVKAANPLWSQKVTLTLVMNNERCIRLNMCIYTQCVLQEGG